MRDFFGRHVGWRDLDADAVPGLSFHGALMAGGAPLTRPFSLQLTGGQWTAVLGRSGVGKSTLLKRLAGLGGSDAAPSGAAMADDGRPLIGRTAWMAQSDLLQAWASVRANAALGARLRDEILDWDAVDRALAAVGLSDKADARPDTLSGGQRQRAALARTLLERRPIALLDEPFSALDAATRADLQDLAAARLRGRTVVFATHDPLETARLAHRAVLLTPNGVAELPTPASPPPRPVDDPAVAAAAAALSARVRAA